METRRCEKEKYRPKLIVTNATTIDNKLLASLASHRVNILCDIAQRVVVNHFNSTKPLAEAP
jgi:hypothetical protein